MAPTHSAAAAGTASATRPRIRARRRFREEAIRSETTGRALFFPASAAFAAELPLRQRNSQPLRMLNIDRTEEPGRCVLRLRGPLRLSDARDLFERALHQDCDRLILDFTASELEDGALFALAELLGQAHLRLAVRGLRQRQLRLLEYLGAARPAGL